MGSIPIIPTKKGILTNQTIYIHHKTRKNLSFFTFHSIQHIFYTFTPCAQPMHICRAWSIMLTKIHQHCSRECFHLILLARAKSLEPSLIRWFEKSLFNTIITFQNSITKVTHKTNSFADRDIKSSSDRPVKKKVIL